MKIAVGILFTLVAALCWQLNTVDGRWRAQESQIAKLRSKLQDRTEELRRQCAQQAATAFRQGGYKTEGPESYQNHYNAKLNKCVMTIATAPLAGTRILLDAYELREYGVLSAFIATGRSGVKEAQVVCQLTPLGDNRPACTSMKEFDAYVARHMED